MYVYVDMANWHKAHIERKQESGQKIKWNKQKLLGQSQVRRCYGCLSAVFYFLFYHWVNNLTKSVATLNVFCYTTTISLNLFKDSIYGEKFKENEANVFIGLTVNWFRSALLAAAFLVQLLLSLSPLIRLTDFTQCKLTAANYAKVKRNTNRYVHKRTHTHTYVFWVFAVFFLLLCSCLCCVVAEYSSPLTQMTKENTHTHMFVSMHIRIEYLFWLSKTFMEIRKCLPR